LSVGCSYNGGKKNADKRAFRDTTCSKYAKNRGHVAAAFCRLISGDHDRRNSLASHSRIARESARRVLNVFPPMSGCADIQAIPRDR